MMIDPLVTEIIARVEETARRLKDDPSAPKYHHLVPQSYIARWADDRRIVRATRIIDGRWKDAGPRKVGGIDHFYRLEADDINDQDTPPLLVELLLGELERTAGVSIDKVLAAGPGAVTDRDLIAQMSMYVSAQMTRGQAFRDEQIDLLKFTSNHPQPDELLRQAVIVHLMLQGQFADPETIERLVAESRAFQPISQDSKVQAVQLMVQNWKYIIAELDRRMWTLHRSDSPLLTTDDPVVVVGGPGMDRRVKPGYRLAPVWLLPIDRHHILTFHRHGHGPREPFTLSTAEAAEVNLELIAAAHQSSFERPGDNISTSFLPLPPFPSRKPSTSLVELSRRPTRWFESANPPPAPMARWHQ